MSWNKYFFFALFSVVIFHQGFAQNTVDNFLKPSDSLNISRRNTVVISETALAATALVGLNQLWYKDYPRSDFHFINDNSDWLQMDKAGHVFSSYQLGNIGKNTLQWSGVGRKKQLLYGATAGFVFLSAVEIFDGYSAEWGASSGDVLANATGTALFVSQELIWKEQRIIPKFSFHSTRYASVRPEVLGNSVDEQILKDYNGQTYWLSANMHAFFKTSKIPTWLNLAIGYGAEGMINGHNEPLSNSSLPNYDRYRQYYLSFDVDLTKIKTKSHVLKTLFSLFNTIKVPAPTVVYTQNNQLKWHFVYF
ncbi:DUF2279 domain-containing protein [Flavobacterium sp. GT3R68]|uniref:DUF2279 domain-containing protein n=1 Tax=Flavobacterium sp. GT3R68 TaxID=2594437 RepID=UPI002102B852|nr:DUF2279 domain-containing protein [Flavobacterium sp. GT3R68]